MIRNLKTKTIALGATTTLTMALFMGCSSSSSSSGTTATGDGGGGGGGGGTGVCAKIPQADIQALVPPISSVVDLGAANTCQVKLASGGSNLEIQFNPNDSSKSDYNNILPTFLDAGSTVHQLTGVGDEAFWNEPSDGNTPPQLAAHKGNATCIIQSNDPPDTTLKTTPNGSGGGYTVADADAASYAALMGKVCNDVFAAL